MGAREFGQLVTARMDELDLSQNRLASRLGELPDGRIFDATQIRLLRQGRRRLDQVLVARLIEVLELDPAQAWEAAGLLPPDMTAEELRLVQRWRRRREDRNLAPVDPPEVAASQASADLPGKLSGGLIGSAGGYRLVPAGRAA